jgi:hypothetical protein
MERHDSIHTRAYFLNASRERLAQKCAPHFVSPNLAGDLSPVPVFRPPGPRGTNQPAGPFAVSGINDQTFRLYFGQGGSDLYHLPVYNDGTGKYKRAALTPLAVTADLTVVGGVCAICWWAERAGADNPIGWIP